MQAVTDSAMQPATHAVKLDSSAMPHTVGLCLMLMQPFLVEGRDPTPPWDVIYILTGAIFPKYMVSGCFGNR